MANLAFNLKPQVIAPSILITILCMVTPLFHVIQFYIRYLCTDNYVVKFERLEQLKLIKAYHDSKFGTCDSQDNDFNQKKTGGLQPVSKPVERILVFFRKVLMQKCVKKIFKGETTYMLRTVFIMLIFRGFFFVGGGDAKVDSRPVFHR